LTGNADYGKREQTPQKIRGKREVTGGAVLGGRGSGTKGGWFITKQNLQNIQQHKEVLKPESPENGGRRIHKANFRAKKKKNFPIP